MDQINHAEDNKEASEPQMDPSKLTFHTKNLDVFYGSAQALFGIDLDIYRYQVTALIGRLVVENRLTFDASTE